MSFADMLLYFGALTSNSKQWNESKYLQVAMRVWICLISQVSL